MYDDGGAIDFRDVFQQSIENFRSLTATAGKLSVRWREQELYWQ